MIAENPSNPLNLVAGGLYQYASAANDTNTYYSSGVSGAFTSWDGGRTWVDQTLPSNPNWFNTSSSMCDQLHLADTAIGFGPNNVVYYIDLGDALGNLFCQVPTVSLAIYSTVSTDGGQTWGTPVPVHGSTAGSFMDKPWIAVDPVTGEAYVAYNDDSNGTVNLQNSTDEGQHWSQPVVLSSTADGELGVELVVDPGGGVDVSWINVNTGDLMFTRSTDHGASFSTPTRIATAISGYPSSSPDAFRDYTLPSLAVDAFAGNPYTGDLFLTWQNGTGGSAGNPMVSLSRSSDDGATWTAPVRVNSDRHPQDYQPSLAIGADGAVYVDWFAVDPVSGHYRLAAAVSHDGGMTYDRQFNASDVDSFPYTSATGYDWWIGDYTHTMADRTGARPLWTDARSPLGWNCPGAGCIWGYVYNITFYTALLVNDSLSASVPVDLSVNGTMPYPGTVALSPRPTPADWMVGQEYNLTASSSTVFNGTPYSFAYWYGNTSDRPLVFSTSPFLNGTVAGGEHFTACYATSVTGTCHLPGAPGYLSLTVVPANASVTINGVPVSSGTLASPLIELPGTYWVNATAPLYYPFNASYQVSPGNTTEVSVLLTRITGNLVGTVSPSNAAVLVNGTPIAVAANGSFFATLSPGAYGVTASAFHYYTYVSPTVTIQSGQDTHLSIVLLGYPGWINGTVDPIGATVLSNGAPVAVAADGSFSLQLPPGTYWVNASRPGWTSNSSGPIVLGPFAEASVSLRLTEYLGAIAGILVPDNASVLLNDSPVTVSQGHFQLDAAPGAYTLNVSAWSYEPLSLPIHVRANVTLPLSIVLNLSTGWIRGSVSPLEATVSVDGQPVVVLSDGSFNLSARAGSHQVEVDASGYTSWNHTVVVDPGRAAVLTISLEASPATSSSSVELPLLLGGVVVAVVLATVVVLLWRRRRTPPRP